MSTTQSQTAPTPSQLIAARLDSIDARLAKLDEFATLLAAPLAEGEPNYFDNMTRLLGLLVGGTEETHKSLRELHARLVEPGIARAIERAIKEP
jgi:hypothetical protein